MRWPNILRQFSTAFNAVVKQEWGLEQAPALAAHTGRCNQTRGARMTVDKRRKIGEALQQPATEEMAGAQADEELACENHSGAGALRTCYTAGLRRTQPSRAAKRRRLTKDSAH